MTRDSALPIFWSDGSLDVLAADEPGAYTFVPGVQPEVTSRGEPTLILVRIGAAAILQGGVQLSASPSQLNAARSALQRLPGAASPVLLDPADMTPRSAALVIRTGEPRQEQVLCKVVPSALPPYSAILHAILTPEASRLIERALAGETGHVFVTYDVRLARKRGVRVWIDGTPPLAAGRSATPPSPADAARLVDDGLASGRLTLRLEAWGGVDDDFVTAAVERAKGKAAAFVRSLAEGSATPDVREDRLSVNVLVEEPRSLALPRESDIALWFSRRRGASFVPIPPEGGRSHA
jgi:hypothetical protein